MAQQPQVIWASLSLIPNQAGAFKMGEVTWYYASAGHTIQILDENFNLRRTIYLPSDVAGYQFADLDNDGYADLIELAAQAAFVRYAQQDILYANRQILVSDSFALPLYVNDIESVSLCADFDGNGKLDLFLPRANGTYGMYLQEKSGYTLVKQFAYRLQGSFSDRIWKNSEIRSNSLRSAMVLPRAYFKDLNKDGLPDVYFRIETAVYYLRSHPDSSLPPRERALAQQKIVLYPVSLSEIYAALCEISDLDNDGQLDLIFSVIKGLGLNIRSEITIFWGKEGLPQTNEKTFQEQLGAFFPPLVVNLKDQHALLIPVIQPGVAFFASYVLRSKITITVLFFKLVSRKLQLINSHQISFTALATLFPAFTSGDFNGDGISDFAFGQSLAELLLFEGNEDFAIKKVTQLTLPSYGILKPIARQHHDDLLLYLPQNVPGYERNQIYLIKFNP